MKKSDALAIDFSADKNAAGIYDRLAMLKKVNEQGCVFLLCSPCVKGIKDYSAWLEYLKQWHDNAVKFTGCAGVWIQDWKKMNKIWRDEK